MDGNFTISVPKNASLAISYIGYKEVIIAAKPSLKIVMEEDSKMIDEVVVTGYMAEKKASLTGSVAVVKMKEVADIPTGNVMSGLQGRVAGMNVTTDVKPGGGNTDTKLRGITTINNYRKKFLVTFIIIQHILMQSIVTLQFRQKLFKQGYILFHQNGEDHQNNM